MNNKTVAIIGVVGIVAVAGYFIYQATTTSGECAGTWVDNVNPACLLSGVSSEINTILIITAILIALIFLFGPGLELVKALA